MNYYNLARIHCFSPYHLLFCWWYLSYIPIISTICDGYRSMLHTCAYSDVHHQAILDRAFFEWTIPDGLWLASNYLLVRFGSVIGTIWDIMNHRPSKKGWDFNLTWRFPIGSVCSAHSQTLKLAAGVLGGTATVKRGERDVTSRHPEGPASPLSVAASFLKLPA